MDKNTINGHVSDEDQNQDGKSSKNQNLQNGSQIKSLQESTPGSSEQIQYKTKVNFLTDDLYAKNLETSAGASHMLGDLDMSANRLFLISMIIMLCIPAFQLGYGIGYQNQLTACFEAKFGWKKGTDADLHNAYLGSSIILGMTIGALIGGVLMRIGRRRSMFICCFMGITGNLISMNIGNFPMVIFGRFLFGLTSGLYTTIVPKMMEETIPSHHFSLAIAVWIGASNFALLFAFLLGGILPEDDNVQALKDTDLWLVFYIYVPVSMQLIFLVSLIFLIKYEPIKFLIAQDRNDEAVKAVRQIYKYAKDDGTAQVYIDRIKSVSSKGSSRLTLKDALFNPKYRKATWINIGQIIFHELTGVNVINQYCNIIFRNMHKSGNSSMTPRQGTYIVGLFLFLSSIISTQTVKSFGRKTLLVWGHVGIAIVHFGVAVFNIYNCNIGVVVMIILFELIYGNTSGPVTWIYTSETTIDAGMGICLLSLWGTVFLLSILCPITLDPENLGPNGTFFALSAFSVFGCLYAQLFIKETFGKSEKEKKLIYTPEDDDLNAQLLQE